MEFSDPTTNVLQMGLSEGMKVADLGSGSGHYALAASGVVGVTGQIYAVDIQEDILKHVRDAAADKNLKNIETIWGDFEKPGGTKLRDGVVDAVILSNTLFQLEHKAVAVAEIQRILKPGGKLLVADWAGAYGGIGPAEHQVVSEHEAEELFITAGFHKVKSFRGGPHHYSVLFTSP
ncbi:MAG: type 11 methyltransferase [Parcubacteria group bacterium]|nr:type 11 methyltransferase [Parcubacteria group bacterium]